MTILRLAGLAAGCALVFSLTPAMAQDATPPAPPSTQQPGGQVDMEAIRQMMRQMMRETMQEEMENEARRGERERAPRMTRPQDRDYRMARRGGMERRGMMRGHDRMMMRGQGDRMRLMHGAGMRILFAIVDTDGDGALSLAEIQDVHGRIFDAADENGDGRVDMEEIGAFFHGGSGPDDED